MNDDNSVTLDMKKQQQEGMFSWTKRLVKQMAQRKKEFRGPGLHLRPVCSDRAWPPIQWNLKSVLSACGNDNGR